MSTDTTETPSYMTPVDFAAKVDWEGGIEPALDYGLKHTELDANDPASAKLRETWAALETAWKEHFKPAADAVQEVLNDMEGPEA